MNVTPRDIQNVNFAFAIYSLKNAMLELFNLHKEEFHKEGFCILGFSFSAVSCQFNRYIKILQVLQTLYYHLKFQTVLSYI